eukprot:SAG31_NODE_1010_length_10388_cov_3.740014_3_plen_1462_part_00
MQLVTIRTQAKEIATSFNEALEHYGKRLAQNVFRAPYSNVWKSFGNGAVLLCVLHYRLEGRLKPNLNKTFGAPMDAGEMYANISELFLTLTRLKNENNPGPGAAQFHLIFTKEEFAHNMRNKTNGDLLLYQVFLLYQFFKAHPDQDGQTQIAGFTKQMDRMKRSESQMQVLRAQKRASKQKRLPIGAAGMAFQEAIPLSGHNEDGSLSWNMMGTVNKRQERVNQLAMTESQKDAIFQKNALLRAFQNEAELAEQCRQSDGATSDLQSAIRSEERKIRQLRKQVTGGEPPYLKRVQSSARHPGHDGSMDKHRQNDHEKPINQHRRAEISKQHRSAQWRSELIASRQRVSRQNQICSIAIGGMATATGQDPYTRTIEYASRSDSLANATQMMPPLDSVQALQRAAIVPTRPDHPPGCLNALEKGSEIAVRQPPVSPIQRTWDTEVEMQLTQDTHSRDDECMYHRYTSALADTDPAPPVELSFDGISFDGMSQTQTSFSEDSRRFHDSVAVAEEKNFRQARSRQQEHSRSCLSAPMYPSDQDEESLREISRDQNSALHHPNRDLAATKLQAAQRGRSARTRYRRHQVNDDKDSALHRPNRDLAATKLQAAQRGRSTRTRYRRHQVNDDKVSALHRPNRDLAATKLQAAQRGRSARVHWRREQAIDDHQRRIRAATKLQAAQRGKICRSSQRHRINAQQEAAIRLQAVERGRAARKSSFSAKAQHAAATKVQAVQRGRVGREQYAIKAQGKRHRSAVGVQRMYRGRRARKDLRLQSCAAKDAQRAYRGHLARRQLAQSHGAAVQLQTVTRGRAQRKLMQEDSRAATAIQAIQRGKSARCEFQRHKLVAIEDMYVERQQQIKRKFRDLATRPTYEYTMPLHVDAQSVGHTFVAMQENCDLCFEESNTNAISIQQTSSFGALQVVSKGSLRSMIELLTLPTKAGAEFDSAGWETILLTTTASTTELLELLVRRYIIPLGVGGVSAPAASANAAVRQMTVIAILHWIQLNFLGDIRLSLKSKPNLESPGGPDEVSDACLHLRTFLDTVVGRTNRAAASLLIDALEKQQILYLAAERDRAMLFHTLRNQIESKLAIDTSLRYALQRSGVAADELDSFVDQIHSMGTTALPQEFNDVEFHPHTAGKVANIDHLIKNVPVADIAQQLTLIEHAHFCAIKRTEYLSGGWHPNSTSTQTSPNIEVMIRISDQLSRWVATTIVREETLDIRVWVLEYWVRAAEYCAHQLQNMNTMAAIIHGLSIEPVFQLTETWAAFYQSSPTSAGDCIFCMLHFDPLHCDSNRLIVDLSLRHVVSLSSTYHACVSTEMYRDLRKLVSRQDNYGEMRVALQQMDLPAVPHLGVYLSDLDQVLFQNGSVAVRWIDHVAERSSPTSGMYEEAVTEPQIDLRLARRAAPTMAQLAKFGSVPYWLSVDEPILRALQLVLGDNVDETGMLHVWSESQLVVASGLLQHQA